MTPTLSDEAIAIAAIDTLFDADYYRTRYADVFANPQIDALRHYCSVGWKQGRDPTNWFSTRRYLASHPEVAEAGVNPFVHYVLVRRDEFRRLTRHTKGIDAPLEYTIDDATVDRHGILHVTGWIVSFAPLQEIAISFSGRTVGLAEYGLQRTDVGAVYANYPESDRSGFSFIQELDADLSEPLVTVEITALGGIKRQATTVPTIAPIIQRRQHRDDKIHYHVDSLTLSDDGMLVVEGWAFSGAGIDAIAVDLDETAIGAAIIGLPRPDVGNAYPLVATARWAGFRISKNLNERFEGEHTVVLTLQSEIERRVVPMAIVATGRQQTSGVIEFNIDSPKIKDGQVIDPVYGDLSVVGWAVAPTGIERVEVFLNDEFKGNAYFGARRNDIKAVFPTMFEPATSGFGMSIPKRWSAGTHAVRVVVHDRSRNIRQQEFSFEARSSDDAEIWRLRRKVKQAEIDLQLAICDAMKCRPNFVLLLRLRDGSPQEMLRARQTIASLQDQVYRQWRLLVVRQAGVSIADLPENVEIIEEFEPANFGSAMVGLIRAGDDLGADALLEFAVNSALHPEATILYCDERRYDYATKSVGAFFKPDWSPDLLLSTNYLGRLWFVRANVLGEIGFTVASLRSGEYDFLLRLTDVERTIRHIPKLLCNTHARPSDSVPQERQALRQALQRRGIAGDVLNGCAPHHYRVKRTVTTEPLVSIIVPTIAAKGLIKTAITSIRERTIYRNFEIICIDGIPRESEWKGWLRDNADQIVKAPKKFNWSRCNNMGVAQATGDYFVFLNDDMEVTDPHWLHALLEHAQRPEVGVVGPLLLYPEGKIQHAGLVLMEAGGKHVFRFAEADDPGSFGLIQTQRNMIAVTGACMMVSRTAFAAVGGFDEAHAVINNDMDFCLRCWQKGLRVVYTPHTRLIHYEESSRSELGDDYDASHFDRTWKRVFALGDPYTNPNLAREHDGYRAESEPTEILHVAHPFIAASEVQRILAVKLDHIGDFITAIPAINRLRERFPTAEITALVGPASGHLARATASIDRVIEFAFFHTRSGHGRRMLNARMLADLRETLTAYQFDIAVDLRQQMDTRDILKYTGAKWLAGYDLRGAAPWLDIVLELVIDNRLEAKRNHVSDSLIQMTETVATACHATRRVFPHATKADARRDFAALPSVADLCEKLFRTPLVCIHPGVGSVVRQWPPEHFAMLADLLIEGEGARVIVIGSPDELSVTQQMMGCVSNKDAVYSLVGKTRVGDLPQVLQSSDLFIGNNSGPHHLAAGLGVPTIGVHSGVVDAVEWGPLGPNAVAIRRDMNCAPCYLEKVSDCHRGHACMTDLMPREVYRISQRLLALSSQGVT